MKALVDGIRERLLATRDTVCLDRARLATEANRKWGTESAPLAQAKTFVHILRNMTLDVDSNPIFAGNTSSKPRAWMLIPEYGFSVPHQILIENDGLEHILDWQIPEEIRAYWQNRSFGGNSAVGHLAVDLDRLIHVGLEAMIAEIDAYESVEDGDASAFGQTNDSVALVGDRRMYRQAMRLALQGVIDWSLRYADEADAAAGRATDPLIRAAHLRVASACRRVPAKPARDLFEGLQAIALVHLALTIEGHGMSISVGLPDRVLAPFIDRDFDAGYATQLIAAFMLKIAATSVFGRGSKTQPITIGGVDHTGRDRCNALTLCFLEACDMVRVGDPHLFLRWHGELCSDVKSKAADMLSRGVSMPLLVNDAPTTRGFIEAGISRSDAFEYCVIGCNELGIPGRSAESATSNSGLVQYLEILNKVLLDHPNPDAIQSMNALTECIERHMTDALSARRREGERERLKVALEMPSPFTSALMNGCINRGQDFRVGMDYHPRGMYERGLTNAINALAAIEKHVFVDNSLSLSELVSAMRADFPDHDLRAMLLSGPRWGSDDEGADRWARVLLDMRERVLDRIDDEFGGKHVVCHVVRSLHYIDGLRIAASPDGRKAWAPVCDSIGAEIGSAKEGPIGVLASLRKIDASKYYRGGYNLNVTLTPAEAAPKLVLALVDGFFDDGGQELQINCFDTDTLRAAQLEPGKYGDLVVRVAGLSARFVDLSRVEQNELIARAVARA